MAIKLNAALGNNQNDLEKRFNQEMKDFMSGNKMPVETYPAKMAAYVAFALSFENPNSAKASVGSFIKVLATKMAPDEEYTLQEMQMVLVAAENRTLSDYCRTESKNPLDGYCTFLDEMANLTTYFNAIIEPKVKEMRRKYESIRKLN